MPHDLFLSFNTILCLLGLALIFWIVYLFFSWREKACPKWYKFNFGAKLAPLTWDQVKIMMEQDPIKDLRKESTCSTKWFPRKAVKIIKMATYSILIFTVFIFSIILISEGIDIFLIVLIIDVLQSNWENSYLFLGILIPAIIGALAIVYRTRLVARAQNRQQWIQEMRETIRNLIVIIANYSPDPVSNNVRDEYKKNIFKLELLINPSEKEHRALLALIRRGSRFSMYQKWGGFISGIDDKVLKEISCLVDNIKPCKDVHSPNGKCPQDPSLRDELCCNCWVRHENLSRVIRLSNAILKREWEQVKYVR